MAAGTLAAATAVTAGRSATIVSNGASPTATDGDNFANTGVERLAVYNPEASAVNCSFTISATLDGVAAAAAKVVSVASGSTGIIGPFPPGIFGSTTLVTCALAGAGSLANVKLKLLTF